MLADGTGLPDDAHPDLAARGPLIEDHLLHDEPEDVLALDRTCRAPQLGQIFTQRNDLGPVRRGQRNGLLPAPALVFRIDLLYLPQPVLPNALQRACYQAVLRLDGIVLAACPLRLVARPLALERPLVLKRPGFVLKLAKGGNREREPIRRERFE